MRLPSPADSDARSSRFHILTAALAAAFFTAPSLAQTVVRVPQDAATLQIAINTVPDGGIIEMAAGTYASPADGFLINDANRSFTIRAASGATVVLDGQSSNEVLRVNGAAPVTFQDLTFANGFGATFNDLVGGVSLKNATATFVGCRFENNRTDPSLSGGGGVQMISSEAFFVDCVWQNNRSKNFAGALAVFESTAWVHASQVLGNRVNFPGHVTTATGGGFTVTASDTAGSGPAKLRVTNTRFQDNQAAFAGGAIYSSGLWVDPLATPRADVVVADCTFENNVSEPDPSVTPPSPPEGGAIHSEDQTTTRIFNSRFLENSADIGGAISAYRAITEVNDSVFRGNRASTTSGGLGGSISVTSNDTASDGSTNRRTASLSVIDSLIQCHFGTVTGATARTGGAIFTTGDTNRRYGLGGVTRLGSAAANRSSVTLDGIAVFDCETNALGGGALSFDLVDLELSDSLVMESTASVSLGGGLRMASESDATITDTAFAANTAAAASGGAVFASGSALDLSDSDVVECSSATPGSGMRSESKSNIGGSGIDADMTGTISGTTFSNNTGTRLLQEIDDDNGPINDLRYNGNAIFNADSSVFNNTLTSPQTVAGLNTLQVVRGGAADTVKSQVDNTALGSAPVVGKILAVPPQILAATASGDAASETESFAAYAWSGGSATLNGGPVNGNAGVTEVGVGQSTLQVAGTPFVASVTQGALPGATFTASAVANTSDFILEWNVTSGTFLDMAIDQGVSVTPAASGSVQVTPPDLPATYRLFVVTEQGGLVEEVELFNALIFTDGFESGNTAAWDHTSP